MESRARCDQDMDKVPEDFPELKGYRVYWKGDKFIEGGFLYAPYYNALEVWEWFKEMKQRRLEEFD